MTAHPIDLTYVDNTAVSKAAVRGYAKLRNRLRVADATEVRNTDLSGQFAGLYVQALSASFDINTADSTTVDDGVNCIRDSAGNGFFRVAVSVAKVEKVVTVSTSSYTIADDDAADNFLINNTSGGAITVYLPSAAARTKEIGVFDGGGNAGTSAITVTRKAATSQTVMSGTSYVLDVNGAGIRLTPRADGTGYF